MNITELMHIHSLNGELRKATIVEMVGENAYIAEYNGIRSVLAASLFHGSLIR